MKIIFLDIDGVLNCELHYKSQRFADYVKSEEIDRMEYYSSQLCRDRIALLNGLCDAVGAQIVISSTWRMGKTVEQLQEILNHNGATFTILDKTGKEHCGNRGCEIKEWLSINCKNIFGIHHFDFYDYAIIDDDSDMLLEQANHFFQTDSYSGLTPTTCYKIKRFFTHKTFEDSAIELFDK